MVKHHFTVSKPSESGFETERQKKRNETDVRRKVDGVERSFFWSQVKLIRAQGECLGIRSR